MLVFEPATGEWIEDNPRFNVNPSAENPIPNIGTYASTPTNKFEPENINIEEKIGQDLSFIRGGGFNSWTMIDKNFGIAGGSQVYLYPIVSPQKNKNGIDIIDGSFNFTVFSATAEQFAIYGGFCAGLYDDAFLGVLLNAPQLTEKGFILSTQYKSFSQLATAFYSDVSGRVLRPFRIPPNLGLYFFTSTNSIQVNQSTHNETLLYRIL